MNKDIFHSNIMIIYMVVFSLIMELIGILIVEDPMSFTLGILFGLIFSILKLMLMKNTIKKSVAMPEAKAQRYANAQYMIRYVLTGIVLVIAALEPEVSLMGTFLGIVSMKAAAYLQLFTLKKSDRQADQDLGK